MIDDSEESVILSIATSVEAEESLEELDESVTLETWNVEINLNCTIFIGRHTY